MTHSSRNPTGWVQSGPGPGLPWQSRVQGWGPGSLAERVYPTPPRHPRANPLQESAAGSTSPSRRGQDTRLRARAREDPGRSGPRACIRGHKQGRALCRGQAAGRLVPVPLPAPVPPLPAGFLRPQRLGSSAAAAAGGQAAILASSPLPPLPLLEKSSRAQRSAQTSGGRKAATESRDCSDLSTSWLFTEQALRQTQGRPTWLFSALEGRKVRPVRGKGGVQGLLPPSPKACFPKTLWSSGGSAKRRHRVSCSL